MEVRVLASRQVGRYKESDFRQEMTERKLSEKDMVGILEEIAREGSNAAARIAAIKVLREMGSDDLAKDEGEELYKDWTPRLKAV